MDTSVLDCAQEGLAGIARDVDYEQWSDEAAARRLVDAVHPAPGTPPHTTRALEAAISAFSEAHARLRTAIRVCERWHWEKPERKMAAIKRIMADTNPLSGKGHSATSAEAVVETDEAYRTYLECGSALTLLRMEDECAVQVAEARLAFLSRRSRSDF